MITNQNTFRRITYKFLVAGLLIVAVRYSLAYEGDSGVSAQTIFEAAVRLASEKEIEEHEFVQLEDELPILAAFKSKPVDDWPKFRVVDTSLDGRTTVSVLPPEIPLLVQGGSEMYEGTNELVLSVQYPSYRVIFQSSPIKYKDEILKRLQGLIKKFSISDEITRRIINRIKDKTNLELEKKIIGFSKNDVLTTDSIEEAVYQYLLADFSRASWLGDSKECYLVEKGNRALLCFADLKSCKSGYIFIKVFENDVPRYEWAIYVRNTQSVKPGHTIDNQLTCDTVSAIVRSAIEFALNPKKRR